MTDRTRRRDRWNSGSGSRGGPPQVVFAFTIEGGAILQIEMLADPELLRELDLVLLG